MLGSKVLSLAVFGLASLAKAKLVEYSWDISWINANPDGAYERRVMTVNGQFPCPPIEAEVGDTIRLHLTNKLGDQVTGLHFHGIDQIGTPWADGASGVTQCPVPPGSTITYEFLANAAGTFWYHSHSMGQYPDGLRGPLIIRDPAGPCKDKYDDEYVLTLTDWYHNESVALGQSMLVPQNTLFRPPLGPDGMLVNGGSSADFSVEKGKSYRLRIINMAAITSFFVEIPDRNMTVIMQDGSYVEEQSVNQLRIAPAQRYDIIFTPKANDTNVPITLAMDDSPNYAVRPSLPFIKQAYFVIDPNGNKPVTTLTPAQLNPYDEIGLKPLYKKPALKNTRTIVVNFGFCRDENNLPRACFGEGDHPKTFIPQRVPTLYTAASMGEYNTDPSIYGQVNPIILEEDEIVQVVINNVDTVAYHPFHFHGHQFQVIAKGAPHAGNWTEADQGTGDAPATKDTMIIAPSSYGVMRLDASQAAVFLLHCHIEWHVIMGLTVTFIQAPEKLRGLPIPEDHLAVCKAMCIPTEGNAGGSLDPNDTSNFRTVNDPVYIGSTYVPPNCTTSGTGSGNGSGGSGTGSGNGSGSSGTGSGKNGTKCNSKHRTRKSKRSHRLY